MANARADFGKMADPRRMENSSEQRTELFPYLMGFMVLLTMVSVFHVWSRVRVVDLNLQIGEMKREMKEQQQEQSRLKLEVASLKAPNRIEALAKGELGMTLPTEQQVVVIK
jgi:cell division protein FtsL